MHKCQHAHRAAAEQGARQSGAHLMDYRDQRPIQLGEVAPKPRGLVKS